MADRRVTKTGKDDDGDITRLCNPDYNDDWSPRAKQAAIKDIEDRGITYYVQSHEGRSNVEVYIVGGKKHLRTVRDGKKSNNLDNLPDC